MNGSREAVLWDQLGVCAPSVVGKGVVFGPPWQSVDLDEYSAADTIHEKFQHI